MIQACWRLNGVHVGPVEVATYNEVIYPGELPLGLSTLLSVAPIHFWPPIDGLVLSLRVLAPLPVQRGPQAEGPACSERELLSR
jgi:hypothetical protein